MGTSFNNYGVVFDRAYIKYKPLTSLTYWGGRFANPFFHSGLVWSPEVAFDGMAMDFRKEFLKGLGVFATAGAFPLEEIELSSKDKWLYAGQVGLEIKPRKELVGKIGAAYYHFKNTTGIKNTGRLSE